MAGVSPRMEGTDGRTARPSQPSVLLWRPLPGSGTPYLSVSAKAAEGTPCHGRTGGWGLFKNNFYNFDLLDDGNSHGRDTVSPWQTAMTAMGIGFSDTQRIIGARQWFGQTLPNFAENGPMPIRDQFWWLSVGQVKLNHSTRGDEKRSTNG